MARRRNDVPDDLGRRQSTIKDVAELAGVSLSTVSRVVAGNYPVARSTRLRVQRAIEQLNYVANTHARVLGGGPTRTVGFIVNDVRGPAFAAAVHGVEQEAARRGHICLVATTDGDPARELAAIQLMREQRAAAVFLIGGATDDAAYRARMADIARSLDAAGSRLVLCGRPALGKDIPATAVEYDNEGGAYALTSFLVGRGHRRILYVGGDPAFTTTAGRLAGFRRAMGDLGCPVDESLFELGTNFTRESGYERVGARLSGARLGGARLGGARLSGARLGGARDFTAIFAETDVIAGGAMAAVFDAGLSVPEDVSLVGYDDIPLAADLRPGLTTVRVPYEELGRAAVRAALDRPAVRSEQHQTLGTYVVIRQSADGPSQA
ncbi:LacI family DNA-binding transcriptional regulator [Nonomuraea angiospora]|uniref:LacI family DNA-binding transcriptional regulator n=1 Tax=Nonomuraea angiospora TaxID=46172 RepID=UPI00344E1541